jgi:hypothetical protein
MPAHPRRAAAPLSPRMVWLTGMADSLNSQRVCWVLQCVVTTPTSLRDTMVRRKPRAAYGAAAQVVSVAVLALSTFA